MARVKKANYIDNQLFTASIKEFLNKKRECEVNSKLAPRMPDSIGLGIMKIAEKLGTRGNFSNYTWKDEMISDGIVAMINAVPKFNPDKYDNALAYLTSVCWRAFIIRIQAEKGENSGKDELVQRATTENIASVNDFDDVFSFKSLEHELSMAKRRIDDKNLYNDAS